MLALEIVTDALRNIGVISEIETPSAEQGADGVRKLNELMASLAEDGIDLGWVPIDDTGDTVVFPAGEVRSIKALLSANLAPIYGAEIPSPVAAVAGSGYSRMLRNALILSQNAASLSTIHHGSGSVSNYDIERGY
jgi:hypothetical protein